MNLPIKNLDRKLRALEALKSNCRDVVLLVYADGRTKKAIENVGTVAQEIEAYLGWCSFYEGMSSTQPELVEVKNLTKGETWNLKQSAKHSAEHPMTDEEADRICKEILKERF